MAARCYSHGKVETDEEFDARWVTYFNKPDIDAWELRKGKCRKMAVYTKYLAFNTENKMLLCHCFSGGNCLGGNDKVKGWIGFVVTVAVNSAHRHSFYSLNLAWEIVNVLHKSIGVEDLALAFCSDHFTTEMSLSFAAQHKTAKQE